MRSNSTGRRRTRASYDVWKLSVTSTDFGSRVTTRAPPVSRSRPAGALSRNTTCSSLIPIFRRAGCLSSRPCPRECRRGGAPRLRPCSSPARQPGSKRLTKSVGRAATASAGTTRRWPAESIPDSRALRRSIRAIIPRTSPSSARSAAIAQRVSPVPTVTTRVGSGVPASPVATEPAATRMPIASASTRENRNTTTRPRRVSRTGLRGAHGPERRCDRQGAHRDLQGKGKVLVLGVEVATDSGPKPVRSCLLIDQTFDRTHVRS